MDGVHPPGDTLTATASPAVNTPVYDDRRDPLKAPAPLSGTMNASEYPRRIRSEGANRVLLPNQRIGIMQDEGGGARAETSVVDAQVRWNDDVIS